MLLPRVIPCLLINKRKLVKGIGFNNHKYVGDPINTLRIFNEKEVDEIIVLDIGASKEKRLPDFDYIKQLASECFMPLTYGGGVNSIEHARQLFRIGVEKVAINTAAIETPTVVRDCALEFGSQSLIISIDVKKKRFGGYTVCKLAGRKKTKLEPVDWARQMQDMGAGELLINSISNDGKMKGYDLEITSRVCSSVSIPVIACGGAGTLEDIGRVIYQAGASAAAAGSLFVYYGKRRAVLINYPTQDQLAALFSTYK